MGYLELALIGVGLSMDAFAVSVCKGLSMRKVDKKYMFVLAVFFGGFQALMPALGWLLGSQFQSYITAIDHWIAFILLVLIGGKMILDVIKEKGENEEVCPDDSLRINLREIFLLAIATSIDGNRYYICFSAGETDHIGNNHRMHYFLFYNCRCADWKCIWKQI